MSKVLGVTVKDTITGLEGIVVAECRYISGLIEYGIRPKAKDGTRPQIEWIEEVSLVNLGEVEHE